MKLEHQLCKKSTETWVAKMHKSYIFPSLLGAPTGSELRKIALQMLSDVDIVQSSWWKSREAVKPAGTSVIQNGPNLMKNDNYPQVATLVAA